jgi:hypothetical protein
VTVAGVDVRQISELQNQTSKRVFNVVKSVPAAMRRRRTRWLIGLMFRFRNELRSRRRSYLYFIGIYYCEAKLWRLLAMGIGMPEGVHQY